MISAMRTLVDIPSEQIRSLAELSARFRRPRAALIRDAIAEYLANHRPPAEDAFGLWGKTAPDGLKYQKKLRAEW
jgi:metal-responsive CopG/Arc/MetJ family transcriptional regulator